MEDYARRNLKDFLSMYNQFTELCFNHCIQNLNYRHLVPEEAACTDHCAEKLINVNHRLISTYMEVNPLNKQAATLQSGQGQAAEPPLDGTDQPQPLNLAGQVQEVFGSDVVVADGQSGNAFPAPTKVDTLQAADGQGSAVDLSGGPADSSGQVSPTNIQSGSQAATS